MMVLSRYFYDRILALLPFVDYMFGNEAVTVFMGDLGKGGGGARGGQGGLRGSVIGTIQRDPIPRSQFYIFIYFKLQ